MVQYSTVHPGSRGGGRFQISTQPVTVMKRSEAGPGHSSLGDISTWGATSYRTNPKLSLTPALTDHPMPCLTSPLARQVGGWRFNKCSKSHDWGWVPGLYIYSIHRDEGIDEFTRFRGPSLLIPVYPGV